MFSLSLGMVRATSCRPWASPSALARRGHDVRLLGHRSIDERCGSDGWRFRPFVHTADYDSTRPLDLEARWRSWRSNSGSAPNVARDVRDELDREPADVLLVDSMLIGGLCAGEASGVPTVALFHAAFSLFRAGPLVEMLAPRPAGGRARSAPSSACRRSTPSRTSTIDARSISSRRRESSSPTCRSRRTSRSSARCSTDPPSSTARRRCRFDIDDGRDPLVLVSFSTSDQAQVPVLQRCIDALAALPARVVVTTGPSIDPAALRAAANTRVTRFVPHGDVLPHASLGRHARRPGHRDVGTQSRRAAAVPAARA